VHRARRSGLELDVMIVFMVIFFQVGTCPMRQTAH
jgi:hypothetical protein